MPVRTYRCTHNVDAMRWFDTPENRETFARWFESHNAWFETLGSVVTLPNEMGTVPEGDWITWSSNEFIAQEHEDFVDTYGEA